MKKSSPFIILIVSISFSALLVALAPTDVVYATSGACSWHEGVDCSAGKDWDGSVICNDGWKDSSVSYSDMDKCSKNNYDYEVRLESAEYNCKGVYSDYRSMFFEIAYEEIEDGREPVTAWHIASTETSDYCDQLKEQNKQESLALCGDTGKWNGIECECYYGDFWSEKKSKCLDRSRICEEIGIENSYFGTDDTCHCNDGYISPPLKGDEDPTCISEAAFCEEKIGKNSYFGTDNTCYCKTGYISTLKENGDINCISEAEFCAERIGENSYLGTDNTCYCKEGYDLSSKENKCMLETDLCIEKYGENTISTKDNKNGSFDCLCEVDYVFNRKKGECVENKLSIKSVENMVHYIRNILQNKSLIFQDLLHLFA